MAMGDACEMIAELRAAVPLTRAKNLLMGATGLRVALAMSLTLTCVCEPSADLTFTVDPSLIGSLQTLLRPPMRFSTSLSNDDRPSIPRHEGRRLS